MDELDFEFILALADYGWGDELQSHWTALVSAEIYKEVGAPTPYRG